jgi:hypothetical protein
MDDAEHLARYATLESAIVELRAELARLQKPKIKTMRTTGRCPSCNGRYLLHVKGLKDVSGDGRTVSISLQKSARGFWGALGASTDTGVLEAYVCKGCRLVELCANSLDDVTPNGNDVVELVGPEDVDPAVGPYR